MCLHWSALTHKSIDQMPISQWVCLVSAIMHEIVDKVETNLFGSLRGFDFGHVTLVLEALVLINLT